MKIEVKKATVKQKPLLENLMQLYLYDFSEFEKTDVDKNGLFDYDHLNMYWKDSNRFPFIVYVDNKIAGFVLVNLKDPYSKSKYQGISEFCILRKYQKQGIGEKVAWEIFDLFPGKWEIRELKKNEGAQKFWKKVIHRYTNGKYEEKNERRGPVQAFDNSEKTK